MATLGIFLIFFMVGLVCSFIMFGVDLANDNSRGLLFLVLGIICLFGTVDFLESVYIEQSRERAVTVGYGEYSKQGVRTIDEKVDYIISGNVN